mmetsp:Transcript_56678/g.82960  ORF Transcript_56678/g.82960 Transcript_56678/m.82960 type:complete len:100 (-) Transcript_56678:362-661(-)
MIIVVIIIHHHRHFSSSLSSDTQKKRQASAKTSPSLIIIIIINNNNLIIITMITPFLSFIQKKIGGKVRRNIYLPSSLRRGPLFLHASHTKNIEQGSLF